MAIKHHFTILCENFIHDKDQKKVAIIGMFSNITLKKIPGIANRIVLLVGIAGDKGDEYTVSLVTPDKKKYLIAEGRIQESEVTKEHRVVATLALTILEDFAIVLEGIYHVELRQGKRLVHRVPFGVSQKKRSRKKGASHDGPEARATE